MSKNRNSQNNRINMGIISTNIDSKGIKNNNFNFSNETSKNLENIKTNYQSNNKYIIYHC